MLKRWQRLLIIVAVILTITIPVAAITFGEPDDGRHPYVALIGLYDENWEWMWRCSGTMISDTVMVTAGHCTGIDLETGKTPAHARIYFDPTIFYDPDLDDYTNDYVTGVPHAHPGWTGVLTIPETHDIGVVVLDEPVDVGTATLPDVGAMDAAATKSDKRWTIVTSVGYGVNDMYPETISLRTRYQAQSFVINLINSTTAGWNIQTSNNPGKWAGSEDYTTGGTCFGDSGGPMFLGGPDSHLIVGVTSFGNSACAGSDFAYRVDTQDSLDFINQFLQ